MLHLFSAVVNTIKLGMRRIPTDIKPIVPRNSVNQLTLASGIRCALIVLTLSTGLTTTSNSASLTYWSLLDVTS